MSIQWIYSENTQTKSKQHDNDNQNDIVSQQNKVTIIWWTFDNDIKFI